MLNAETKRRIDACRDILVGKLPLPTDQVELITLALIYKFMDDLDEESVRIGGKRSYFVGPLEKYRWRALMSQALSADDRMNLLARGIELLGGADMEFEGKRIVPGEHLAAANQFDLGVRAAPACEAWNLRSPHQQTFHPQRMEQLRHRLTNVSPQGQYCSADQNALKRSDLDDFVACLPWRDELRLVHDERLDRAMPYTSRLRSESLFSLMTAGRRSRIELFWKTLPNYSIYTSSGLTILRLNYRSTAICLYQLELGQPL